MIETKSVRSLCGPRVTDPDVAGCEERALHVLVPEAALVQAHRAAIDSQPRLRFKHYLAKLLLSAQPIVEKVGSDKASTPPEVELDQYDTNAQTD